MIVANNELPSIRIPKQLNLNQSLNCSVVEQSNNEVEIKQFDNMKELEIYR
jgi:hypothetical protein